MTNLNGGEGAGDPMYVGVQEGANTDWDFNWSWFYAESDGGFAYLGLTLYTLTNPLRDSSMDLDFIVPLFSLFSQRSLTDCISMRWHLQELCGDWAGVWSAFTVTKVGAWKSDLTTTWPWLSADRSCPTSPLKWEHT
jgi:hypothetical protein